MLTLLWLGCSLTTIQVEETTTTTIEHGTLFEEWLGELGFGEWISLDLTESTELVNQGVAPGDVQDVSLSYLELEALSGSDLSFIQEMSVYVRAPDLPRLEIARSDDFQGQSLVELQVLEVDLTPYVVSQSMTLDTQTTAHRPEQDTLVQASFGMDLRVTAQGVGARLSGD